MRSYWQIFFNSNSKNMLLNIDLGQVKNFDFFLNDIKVVNLSIFYAQSQIQLVYNISIFVNFANNTSF